MLRDHLVAKERELLARSGVAANAGHSIHKGTPREQFVTNFLRGHLSQSVAVGSGEIIDSESVANPPSTAQRPQHDVIVYRPHFPRIEIGEQVHAFLAESVVATIEIKSTLNRAGVAQAVKAARSTKRLRRADHRGMQVGYAPSTILNYLVAYNGPSSMRTVHTWLTAEQQDQGISSPDLPPPLTVDRDNPVLPLLAAQMEGSLRHGSPAPSLDGIFVLGKGFAILDNSRLGLVTDDLRRTNPSSKWQVGNTEQGALLLFFMSLSAAVSGHAMIEYDLTPYTHGVQFPDVGFLP